jgi:hypothetical protein
MDRSSATSMNDLRSNLLEEQKVGSNSNALY